MNIGTLRSLTFVGNERLLGEVISFLDFRALASAMLSCRHFESVIRKVASAALQVRKCITQGCSNGAAHHRTICNIYQSRIGTRAPLFCQGGEEVLISSANAHVLHQLKLLYHSLPRTSPFRTELTAALTKGLLVQNAMQVFGCTHAQIKGKKGVPANHDLLHTILAVPREPRSRHDFVSLFQVQQFWLDYCAPSPDTCVQKLNKHTRVLTLRPIHYQRHNTPELWRAYTSKGGDLSYALFCALKPTQVKDHHLQSCMCPHCAEGKIAKDMVAYFNRLDQEHPLSVEQKKNTERYNEEVAQWHQHKALALTQIREYQRLEAELRCSEGLMVMDSTQVQAKQRDEETGDQWWSHGPGIQWLNFVMSRYKAMDTMHCYATPCVPDRVEVLDSTTVCLHPCKYFKHTKSVPPEVPVTHNLRGTAWEGEKNYTPKHEKQKYPLEHRYYECFSDKEKNMTPYVEHCLQDLQLKGVFRSLQKLYIFSDGASKHFKDKKTLAVVRNLARALGIVIVYYFWCSYHGKGRCDGHFAVGKCMH